MCVYVCVHNEGCMWQEIFNIHTYTHILITYELTSQISLLEVCELCEVVIYLSFTINYINVIYKYNSILYICTCIYMYAEIAVRNNRQAFLSRYNPIRSIYMEFSIIEPSNRRYANLRLISDRSAVSVYKLARA